MWVAGIFSTCFWLTLFKEFVRYTNYRAENAVLRYCELADSAGISPASMALAFVNSRSFVTSNIIGATTMEQLKENIESYKITLSEDVLTRIEEIHTEIPNPCP
jgi:aryl-alcohol dehydrogenase-like predicted oxidoreductase